jgi:hypothetical protein
MRTSNDTRLIVYPGPGSFPEVACALLSGGIIGSCHQAVERSMKVSIKQSVIRTGA